jgi:hypothetical protein
MKTKNTSATPAPANVLEHEGFSLPITTETTQGRKGAEGKTFYSIDFAELLETSEASGKKVEDYASTGENLLKFFRGFDSLCAFLSADFNKAMVSLQVTTPANGKTPKTLSDAEKLAALRQYVSTIDSITRQRSGKASEVKRLVKEQSELMKNFDASKTAKLVELATAIAKLQSEIDSE